MTTQLNIYVNSCCILAVPIFKLNKLISFNNSDLLEKRDNLMGDEMGVPSRRGLCGRK